MNIIVLKLTDEEMKRLKALATKDEELERALNSSQALKMGSNYYVNRYGDLT